tara:strand:- start:72 stop:248 length:177 start_codon:yes stop_codon:yes gene_type:complete
MSNQQITIVIDPATRRWIDGLMKDLKIKKTPRPTRISRKPDSSHAPSPNIDDRCNEKH